MDPNQNQISVLVMHPEYTIYDGPALSVSSLNDKGPFDVLPLHSNFVSLIKEKVTINQLDKKKREIAIEKAIMKVYRNKVYIFVGISEERS